MAVDVDGIEAVDAVTVTVDGCEGASKTVEAVDSREGKRRTLGGGLTMDFASRGVPC